NKLEFLIKWKNYTDENNLWEPKENCKQACNMITQFFKCNPNALHHIARMVYEGMKFQPYQNLTEGTDTIFSHLEVKEVFTVPHIFRASLRGIWWTLHRLAQTGPTHLAQMSCILLRLLESLHRLLWSPSYFWTFTRSAHGLCPSNINLLGLR
ncbi:hypothetical protein L208DRAFT_1292273, partial [Tricholoma matsutake]